MRISDWSSDVCSSDLGGQHRGVAGPAVGNGAPSDVVALTGDLVHVDTERPDVAGRVVAAVERLHEATVGAQQRLVLDRLRVARSEERRVGKGCVSALRFRWPPYH